MPAIFTALLILFIDQLSKFIIVKNFLPGQTQPVIKNIFQISFVCNKGIAFGIFSRSLNFPAVSIIYTCIIIIVFILVFYKHFLYQRKTARLSLALISAGALGNLIDRIRFGCVIDFLDFRIWPVFNIADSAITIGATLLILQIFKHKTKP